MLCDQQMRFAMRVRREARPRRGSWRRHHAGSYRVALHRALAPQERRLGFDQTGAKTSLPKRPGTAGSSLDILYVVLSHVLHQLRGAIGLVRCQQSMHGIGHAHGGVQPYAVTLAQVLEMVERGEGIRLIQETRGAILVTRDNRYGDTSRCEPGPFWYGLDLSAYLIQVHD